MDVVEDEEVEYASPPPVFLSYQWGHQDEVKLIRNHLQMAGYECWMDIGQMGGGDKLFEKIDSGIRGAKVIICCVSEKYAKSPNCNREVGTGIRGAKVIICCVSEKYVKSPNCNREVGTGIRGGKVIICCVSEKYVKFPDCNREVGIG